jgi:NAD(P)-dependent dehydrogenase (short-subunit alcohol dehydrogenase family)
MGRAAARAFADEGALVVGCDVNIAAATARLLLDILLLRTST